MIRKQVPPKIYLASQSPRRKKLLEGAGYHVIIVGGAVDETPLLNESPSKMVLRLSLAKATAAIEHCASSYPLIAADTTVALENVCLGKPQDEEEAAQMLSALSGKTHEVFTGFTLVKDGIYYNQVVRTQVKMRELSLSEIAHYVQSGEPMGKAGAYGIQGEAVSLIDRIEGSLTNVVGLPLEEVLQVVRDK